MNPQEQAVLMFLLHCSGCGRRQLVGIGAIAALVNVPDGGIEVHLRCPSCGRVDVELTGRRNAGVGSVAAPPASARPARAALARRPRRPWRAA